MTYADLKRLKFSDIGIWPWPAKIGALVLLFLALMAVAAFFGWKPQYEDLETKEKQELSLRDEFSKKKARAINLDLHIQQLKEVEQQFGTLLRQLPSKSEMDSLLSDVNQAGLGRGLQFDLFKPSSEQLREGYAEMPVNIRVTGNYHDIAAFASDVSQLSRIVTLNDVAVSKKDPKDVILTMEAVAKTFRYLDDEERAKQRKEKDAQKAAKK
jgi:type IV pilus assembly protein PilO